MSRSSRIKLARLRASYSGERVTMAESAVGRQGELNIDACIPAQQRFRAQFAYFLFNCLLDGTFGSKGMRDFTLGTIVMSPRFDELVVIAKCPVGACSRIMPFARHSGTDGMPGVDAAGRYEIAMSGMPGLRLVAMAGNTVNLLHVTTGARVVITDKRSTNRWSDSNGGNAGRGPVDQSTADWWTTDVPLTHNELGAIDHIPVMPLDIEQLLAGLTARLHFTDAQHSWSNNWFCDPGKRGNSGLEAAMLGLVRRRLTGYGDHWRLEWTGYPHHTDIAAMITHPVIGLDGATARVVGRAAIDVAYKSVILELRPTDAVSDLAGLPA